MPEPTWQLVSDDVCSLSDGGQREAAAMAEALRGEHDWLDVVCGRDSVFVQFDLALSDAEQALEMLRSFDASSGLRAGVAAIVDIPACYDPAVAPDLASTCESLGLTVDEFVEAHTQGEHEVAMLGFIPGFTYIGGLDPRLAIDRLDQPRRHVAAGSIGIAGKQTGIYPFDGPGGWRLVARTPLRLFDPENSPPALLQPAQRVRFVAITLAELEEYS